MAGKDTAQKVDERVAQAINPDVVMTSVVSDMIRRGTMRHVSLTDRLWGKLLSKFPVINTELVGEDCSTMCTDGRSIFYNPNFVRNICLDAMESGQEDSVSKSIRFLLAHELMHVVYRNTASDSRDITFKIPGPYDKAFEKLMDIANKAEDAVINTRLEKEFGYSVRGYKKRTPFGVFQARFYFLEEETERAWTQVFVKACNAASRKMADSLNKKIKEYPDDFFGSIRLFRSLYPEYKEETKKNRKNRNSQDEDRQESEDRQKGSGAGNSADPYDADDPDEDDDLDEEGDPDEEESSEDSAKAGKSREDGKSGKGVASGEKNGKEQDEKADGSEKGKSGKDRSGDSKDGKDGEDKGLGQGDEDDEIDDAVDEALGGNSLMDDHDKNDEIMKNSPVSKAKLDRAMQELQKEIQQEMRRAGQGAFSDSLLISLCRAYFRPKPEPWYVGITLLLKNKIREGRQIRERVPPIEMLTQVMTGNSVVQFEKTGKRLNIAFAVDVSGSMNDEEVVSGVLKIMNFIERNIPKGSHGHKFIFCQVDAGVEEWKDMDIPSREYSAWKREIAEHGFVRRGRGGTEFAPFFKKIAEMKQKPDAVVVFSDMELYDYPQTEKEIGKLKNSVIWLCMNEQVPDEFYKYDIGRVYETSSLFERQEISR